MKTTAVCREVRPGTGNSEYCVILATQDERDSDHTVDPMDALNLAEVSDRLRAQKIVLGGPLPPTSRLAAPTCLAAPIQILAHDEDRQERRLTASHVEEYRLSSGSILYFIYVAKAPWDCRWLVGRPMEIAEPENRSPGSPALDSAADAGFNSGFQEAASPRGPRK